MIKNTILAILLSLSSVFAFANLSDPPKGKGNTKKLTAADSNARKTTQKSDIKINTVRPDPEWIKKNPFYYDPRTKTCPFYFVRQEGC